MNEIDDLRRKIAERQAAITSEAQQKEQERLNEKTERVRQEIEQQQQAENYFAPIIEQIKVRMEDPEFNFLFGQLMEQIGVPEIIETGSFLSRKKEPKFTLKKSYPQVEKGYKGYQLSPGRVSFKTRQGEFSFIFNDPNYALVVTNYYPPYDGDEETYFGGNVPYEELKTKLIDSIAAYRTGKKQHIGNAWNLEDHSSISSGTSF